MSGTSSYHGQEFVSMQLKLIWRFHESNHRFVYTSCQIVRLSISSRTGVCTRQNWGLQMQGSIHGQRMLAKAKTTLQKIHKESCPQCEHYRLHLIVTLTSLAQWGLGSQFCTQLLRSLCGIKRQANGCTHGKPDDSSLLPTAQWKMNA